MRLAHLVVLAALLTLSQPGATRPVSGPVADGYTPSLTNVPELESGFHLLYEQRFPEARAKFTEWLEQHPQEPFGQVALAAGYLFEEFYHQGVLTSDFFGNDKKFLKGIDGKPNAGRLKGFQDAIAHARALSLPRLEKDPNDVEALFALTLAAGMESDSETILEKRHLDGLKRMKEANEYAKEILAVRPDAIDAYIAQGSANYIIGCLSGSARFFLWFGGIHGDKKLGMEQVGKTAEGGRYLKPFAKILLALAARREKQDALAEKLMGELSQEFPRSPLFAAEYAKVKGRGSTSQKH